MEETGREVMNRIIVCPLDLYNRDEKSVAHQKIQIL
jgi:hypothetical protein